MADGYALPKPANDGKAKKENTTDTEDDRDLVIKALKRCQAGWNRDRDNLEAAKKDLEFLAGEDNDQWDAAAVEQRKNRPILTINRLPTFHAQVANDIRMARPAINVVPIDDDADKETAERLGGLIRYIENRSDAQAAYTSGSDSQVACGIGHWKIIKEFAEETTFNKELRIVPVEDSLSVIWDPDAVLPTREDAKWAFEPVDMSLESFKEKWPDATASDFDQLGYDVPSGWYGDEHVRVARYWLKKPVNRTLAMMPGGSVLDLTDGENAEANKAEVEMAQAAGVEVRIEDREGFKICSYLMTCAEILEKTEWPGRYIPIVPVLGKEIKIGRKIVRKGIIRDAKDPQRLYNYMRSAQAEAIALQPKAPFMATIRNVQANQDQWETANTQAYSTLIYDPDPANGGKEPTRVQPPINSPAWTEQVLQAADEIKAVIGIYDASLGNKSNETSGKAILARERQGDVGTFNFVDSFNRAVAYTGRILVDLIPHIYDTERTIRILGEDGKMDTVKVNMAVPTDGINPLPRTDENYRNPHDLTVGSYDVFMKSGPGYSTRREEARETLTAFMQGNKETAPLILDLVAEMQDMPMADEIAERFEHLLPANIRAKKKAERDEPPDEPEPLNPVQQMELAIKEMDVRKAELGVEGAKVSLADKIVTAEPSMDPAIIDQKLAGLQEMLGMISMFMLPDGQGAPPDGMEPGGGPPPPDLPPEAMGGPPGPSGLPPEMMMQDQPPPGGFFMDEQPPIQPQAPSGAPQGV